MASGLVSFHQKVSLQALDMSTSGLSCEYSVMATGVVSPHPSSQAANPILQILSVVM